MENTGAVPRKAINIELSCDSADLLLGIVNVHIKTGTWLFLIAPSGNNPSAHQLMDKYAAPPYNGTLFSNKRNEVLCDNMGEHYAMWKGPATKNYTV